MKFSEKILFLRRRAGLSQEELANRLDVSRQTVYKWESESSMPEIPKIKALAKLFRVSFDYLMDDEIESPDGSEICDAAEAQPEPEPEAIAPRRVFRTAKELLYSQADIDNGYAKNRTVKVKYDGFYDDRCRIMRRALERVGATDVLVLQPGATTAFFYDAKRRVIGFYYSGGIQLVCPIENILAFRFSGGERGVYAVQTNMRSCEARAILSYKDGEQIKELKLDFTVNTRAVLEAVAGKGGDMLEFTWNAMMNHLLKNLQLLDVKLASLMEESKRLARPLPEVDPAFYERENLPLESEYRSYVAAIEQDAASIETRRFIRKVVKWVLIGAAILTVVALIF